MRAITQDAILSALAQRGPSKAITESNLFLAVAKENDSDVYDHFVTLLDIMADADLLDRKISDGEFIYRGQGAE